MSKEIDLDAEIAKLKELKAKTQKKYEKEKELKELRKDIAKMNFKNSSFGKTATVLADGIDNVAKGIGKSLKKIGEKEHMPKWDSVKGKWV